MVAPCNIHAACWLSRECSCKGGMTPAAAFSGTLSQYVCKAATATELEGFCNLLQDFLGTSAGSLTPGYRPDIPCATCLHRDAHAELISLAPQLLAYRGTSMLLHVTCISCLDAVLDGLLTWEFMTYIHLSSCKMQQTQHQQADKTAALKMLYSIQ